MKILLWDIETTPMLVTSWQLHKPFLDHNNIIEESHIVTAAWKWHNIDGVDSACINPARPKDDKAVIRELHRVLGEADVLVAHNGDKFDLKKYNARAIFHGLKPLPKIPTIDTLKVARQVFSFNSNRLDYLARFLLGKAKIHTEYELWLKVMNGDAKALAQMVEYNKYDVELLERVYERLRPYMKRHPNANLYQDGDEGCPLCGSNDFKKRGFKYQATTKRQQYQCLECGSWFCGEFIKGAGLKQ